MRKGLENILKACELVRRGYVGWILYRAGRYLRSFRSTAMRSHLANTEWLSETQILSTLAEFNEAFQKSNRHALCVHLYYSDVLAEILEQTLMQEEKMDLFISLGPQLPKNFFATLAPYKGRVKFYRFLNRGRDVLPFLKLYSELVNYEWVCKIHSKRSPQIRDGELWRQDLIRDLLSKETFAKIQKGRSSVQMIAPRNSLLPVSLFIGANRVRMEELLKKMGLTFPQQDFQFIAGTMFWFRPQALHKLQLLKDVDALFEEESPSIDGLTAHAFERLFYLIASGPTS